MSKLKRTQKKRREENKKWFVGVGLIALASEYSKLLDKKKE